MRRLTAWVLVAATVAFVTPVALATSAEAQVDVYVGTAPPAPPPLASGYGGRDRDGIPNRYDNNNNNNRGAWGDRDRDGVPNKFDPQIARDKDRDGVPNRYDRRDNNPYVR